VVDFFGQRDSSVALAVLAEAMASEEPGAEVSPASVVATL
jgi:hypothetical protein